MRRDCFFRLSHCGAILFMAVVIALCGCSVKFVDDYDAKTYEEIIRLSGEVDKFYGVLLERVDADRKYQDFQAKYVELESELRSLYIRNKSRPLNSESTKISESILDLWIKYKDRHKEKDTYKTGNAELDRERFIRLFISAASAEAAKTLSPDDTDASRESR